ncbi:phospholipase D-like domain-containing protein [Ancylothrix sp. C2]|uniref:phospholipase D-like domain-containing protein n=1 Tax=Ancylothrix sp. D3o TaxID=2953691 RepID=UPI0021BB0A64|nr:phospholipase D-like domain-containing protein [Ancylothrix sp. D3o]MCT7948679.1 phospholipase D-like domain-containing protein [Ancylothrix sp. D3o]
MHPLLRKIPIVIAILTLTGCNPNRPQRPPQDYHIQAYFNNSIFSEYKEPYRQQTRTGDNLEQHIIDTIKSAKTSIDIAVQELRLPKIAHALAERQKVGIKIRIILENTYHHPWSEITPSQLAKLDPREQKRYQELRLLADRNRDNKLSDQEINESDSILILKNAKIPIIDDTADGSKGTGLMHHKFIIIDNTNLLITSANFTTSDIHGDFSNPETRGNSNNLITIKSPELAQLFSEEFNIMWGDGPAGQPDSKFGVKKTFRPPRNLQIGNNIITLQFSPTSLTQPWEQSVNGLIGKTLAGASQSIDLALFVFSEQQLSNILETTARQGVKLRTLIEPSFAYRNYSEGLDMLGITLTNEKCQIEPENRPWQNPIDTVGVPQLPEGDLLHHKFGIIDTKTVITGSHNWSIAANTANDETLLVIQNPTLTAHFIKEYERLYNKANLGIPPFLSKKIQLSQQKCQPLQTKNSQNTALINLNTATQKEIETLPGVGPKLAQQIIIARQQKPFTSLQDLDQIPGVGPKLLEKIQHRVTW